MCTSKIRRLLAGVATITGALLGTAWSQTVIHVDDNAPNDPGPGSPVISDPEEDGSMGHPFDAIQEAIEAAAEGDVVSVRNGVYTGPGNKDIDLLGRAITVRSESGPNNCVIDCEGDGSGFRLVRRGTASTIVDGFTIINGSASGILCGSTAATIRNCIITRNRSSSDGGGISVIPNSGLYTFGPTIVNCVITKNTARTGGGVYFKSYDTSTAIINSTISNNVADFGGAIWLGGYRNRLVVRNCILWNNTASLGPVAVVGSSGLPITLDIAYSDVKDGQAGIILGQGTLDWGPGNIDTEPGFAFPDDYRLTVSSPCIDAGTNDPTGFIPSTDADGVLRPLDGDQIGLTLVDIGAFEFNPDAPSIAISDVFFDFHAHQQGENPPAQILSVRNSGAGTLQWLMTPDCGWLEATPAEGSSSGEVDSVSVLINMEGLSVGEYACTLAVAGAGAGNSPRHVRVTLRLGATRRVPSAYPTIQEAIDAAAPNDVVLVADGTYSGEGNRNLTLRGKAIVLRSENGPEHCILDCERAARALIIQSCVGRDATVDGFTITNGYAQSAGAISIGPNCSPTVRNCVFTTNESTQGYGGAVGCWGDAVITNCVFRNNRTGQNGGGAIYANSAEPLIRNCLIVDNFSSGFGGGIHSYNGSKVTISNCTIFGNQSGGQGGGISCDYDAQAVVTNSIVTGNISAFGPQVALRRSSRFLVSYSNVEGGESAVYKDSSSSPEWGLGNLDLDPRFAGLEDQHLSSESPCIDVGTVDPPGTLELLDVDGNPRVSDGDGDGLALVDLGAYEFNLEHSCIAVSPSSLAFIGPEAGPSPTPQILQIRNCGGGELNWTVTHSCPWLTVTPSNGRSTGEINEVTVVPDTTLVARGDYACVLTVSDPTASNPEASVGVTLHAYSVQYVPSEYATIQEAIDSTIDGDQVVIADGTYTGPGNRNLDFAGRAITVRSQNGREKCIIDCGRLGRGFYFHSGEGPDSVLEGITIMRGSADQGGAIHCFGSGPLIKKCTLTNNWAMSGGGLSCIGNLAPKLVGCLLSYNRADYWGGGVHCTNTGAELQNCVFYKNSAKFGGAVRGTNLFRPMHIVNCTMVANEADEGGGISCWGQSEGSLTNSILWDNQASQGAQLALTPGSNHSPSLTVSFSAVQGGAGGAYVVGVSRLNWESGNISDDPRFALATDFHLSPESPCIDVATLVPLDDPDLLLSEDHDGNARPLDGDGQGGAAPDMGAFEVNPERASIAVAPDVLEFFLGAQNPGPNSQTLSIRNAGGGLLDWKLSGACSWLSVNPVVGQSIDEIDTVQLTARADDLPSSDGQCRLFVNDPASSNRIRSVLVKRHPTILGVPEAYQTVQMAMDEASDSDVVLIADGVHGGEGNRDLDFLGKAITVRSLNGPENCTLDCSGGRGFYFHSGEGRWSIVDGITITNGVPTLGTYGGGIYCKGSSPTIVNCRIVGNSTKRGTFTYHGLGGGIYLEDSGAHLSRCIITGNHSYADGDLFFTGFSLGAGIYSEGGDPLIENCVISDNAANGGVGKGGGLFLTGGRPTVRNCTIANNYTRTFAGGMFVEAEAAVENCILWGNRYEEIEDPLGMAMVRFSNIEGGWDGDSNTDIDPVFVDRENGDYHLAPSSPCIDLGDPASDFSIEPEPDGGRINMGAYGNTRGASGMGWLYIERYELVNRIRVSRTTFGYELNVAMVNLSDDGASDVWVELLDVPDNVTIIENRVRVGDVPAGGSVVSADTFAIRVDRSTLVSPLRISWRISFTRGGHRDGGSFGTWLDLADLDHLRGDFDRDDDTDLKDFVQLGQCVSGPEELAEAACRIADLDDDDDIDLADYAVFQVAFMGTE